MPLTALQINAIKPAIKHQKFADGQGLYLFVPADTAPAMPRKPRRMSWRFDYRYAAKRYTLSLGLYPNVGLAEARSRLNDARKVLEGGQNPAQLKRQEKLVQIAVNADSFKSIADSWYDSKKSQRSSAWKDAHALYLKRDLTPKVGSVPITQISKAMLAEALESTKRARGAGTADRVRQTAVQIFDFAIRKSKAEVNPARLLRGWEEIPPSVSHAPLPADQVTIFLDKVDAYTGQLTTKFCMKLLLLTFVRKTELIEAEWKEIDVKDAIWLIPAVRMKMKSPHIVPLSTQSLEVLAKLKELTGESHFLFPNFSTNEKPMSRTTLNVAFKTMGYGSSFTPHGVRATASTWLNEEKFRADVIERQLAHAERNQIRSVYNKAEYIPERTAMMQAWADFVDPPL